MNIYSIEALKVVFSHKEFIMKENIAIDLKMEKQCNKNVCMSVSTIISMFFLKKFHSEIKFKNVDLKPLRQTV